MAWATLRPLIYSGADGAPEGAMMDLATELANEIGFDLNTFRVPSFPDWGSAQSSGQSTLLPFVAKLPNLASTNVFSDLVTQTNVQLAIRVDSASDFDPTDLTGRLIGVTSPGMGSDPALLPGAILTNYPNIQSALVGLLAGEVDAVSTEAMFAFKEARAARIDHRITFVGPPLVSVDRFVAIHESRADLLGPINAVLAKMKDDGRLAEILLRNNVTLPPSPPDVLTVGVANFPPDNIYNDDGTFSGFAVESLQDLADLAGLQIRFKAITFAEFGAGPTAETYDMLSQAGVSDARRQVMDFTLPVRQLELSIFTRAGDTDGLSDLDSLGTRKVGVESVNMTRSMAEHHGGLDLEVFEGLEALLRGLDEGKVDAILYPSVAMNAEISLLNLTGRIEEASEPFRIIERAPALRFGLGQVRERLNAAIPIYLISSDYAALGQKYYGSPVFWTETRVYMVLSLSGGILIAGFGYVLWQRRAQLRAAYERQQMELEREQVHSDKLTRLVTELERSNRELDEFAYTASHDLKEPLRGIAINADFLARENLSEQGAGRVERMVALATRMEKLVSDLLYFSRLGRVQKVMKNIDTHHIIEGVLGEITEWMDEKQGVVQFASDLPWVHAERSKIKTLFQNLIVNAVKYNDAATKTVEIGFEPEIEVAGETLLDAFWVRDNGIGISDKNHDKVFRIFQRLNREEVYGAGTGAGLSFVRKIVEEYDGYITFSSQLDQGTTFYFSLPLAEPGAKHSAKQKGAI